MQTIETKTIRKLRFPPGNVKQIGVIYKAIERAFKDDDMYALFAMPVTLPENEIEWRTPLEGGISRFDQLSVAEQSVLESKVVSQVQQLMEKAKGDLQLQDKIKKWIELPNKTQDIYRVGQRAVLTRWGFIDEAAARGKGEISYLLKSKKYTVRVMVRYQDGTPVVGQPVDYVYRGQTHQETTNDDGDAIILGISEEATLELQATINEEVQTKTLKVVEDAECKLTFPRLLDMSFEVHHFGTKDPAVQQAFSVKLGDGRDDRKVVSDSEGTFKLNKVKVGTEVSLVHEASWQIKPSRLKCIAGQEIYHLEVQPPPPKIYEKKIKAIYERTGEPLPGAKVIIKRERSSTEQYTADADGIVILRSEGEPLDGPLNVEIEAKTPKDPDRTFLDKLLGR